MSQLFNSMKRYFNEHLGFTAPQLKIKLNSHGVSYKQIQKKRYSLITFTSTTLPSNPMV